MANRSSEAHLSLSSRCFLILALVLLPLLGVATYAGPSFAIVAERLAIDGGIVFLWLIAATAIGGDVGGSEVQS